ncbi:hypothetical protein D3C78_1162130 [compost metagenome]
MPQPQAAAQAPEHPGQVTGAIVGHDPPKTDAQPPVIAQGLKQGPASAGAALVRMQAGEGQPGRIVDGYVDKLPACTTGILLTVAGDPVPGFPEAAKLLDIQMQEIARVGVLVALHRRCRLQLSQAMKTCLLEMTGDGADGQTKQLGDLSVGLAGSAQLDQLFDHGPSRGMGA